MTPNRGPVEASLLPPVLELSRLDCELVAVLTSARLRDPAAEQRRTALLDAVHLAGRDAARRLEQYTRHAVTDCHGSRSLWNVAGDARAFFDALAAYAALVRWTADQVAELAEDEARPRADDGGLRGEAEGQPRGRLRVL